MTVLRCLILPVAILVPAAASAQDMAARVDAAFGAATGWFVALVFADLPGTSFPWIVLWLVAAAAVFTLATAAVQWRGFRHALDLVRGRYSDPSDTGEVSHFQALSAALSGTIGLGNIAGVAVAMSIGGPGATFWMIVAGFLGMASKFTECTLGVKYRILHADGSISGGPMHYIRQGFAERGLPMGRFLAALFAIFCVLGALGGGNMFQANQAAQQVEGALGVAPWVTGVVMAGVVMAVILGGIRSIAGVTARVVPVMGLAYVLVSVAVLAIHAERLPWAMAEILRGAFTETGIAGGIIGALIQGFRRAAFSNEAGVGSAAIAHAAARTREPVSEGIVSLLEPFIDTVVICTLTALVIIVTGQLLQDPETGLYLLTETGAIATASGATGGVPMTSAAFASAFDWAPLALAAVVVLFAFSTMITWSYYGLKAWTYLLGHGPRREAAFKLLFCAVVVVGAVSSPGAVIDFSDAAIFAMSVVNVTALYLLLPVVRRELASYMERLARGEIRRLR